jgi:hypothetical protein
LAQGWITGPLDPSAIVGAVCHRRDQAFQYQSDAPCSTNPATSRWRCGKPATARTRFRQRGGRPATPNRPGSEWTGSPGGESSGIAAEESLNCQGFVEESVKRKPPTGMVPGVSFHSGEGKPLSTLRSSAQMPGQLRTVSRLTVWTSHSGSLVVDLVRKLPPDRPHYWESGKWDEKDPRQAHSGGLLLGLSGTRTDLSTPCACPNDGGRRRCPSVESSRRRWRSLPTGCTD